METTEATRTTQITVVAVVVALRRLEQTAPQAKSGVTVDKDCPRLSLELRWCMGQGVVELAPMAEASLGRMLEQALPWRPEGTDLQTPALEGELLRTHSDLVTVVAEL